MNDEEHITKTANTFEELMTVIGENASQQSTSEQPVERELWGLAALTVEYTHAVCFIAKTNPQLLRPAFSIARSVYEIAVRLHWLGNGNNQQVRLKRYILLTTETQHALQRIGKELESIGGNKEPYDQVIQEIIDQKTCLISQYSIEVSPNAQPPNLKNMESQIEPSTVAGTYVAYRIASQYAHGSMIATAGRPLLTDWSACFNLCFYGINRAAQILCPNYPTAIAPLLDGLDMQIEQIRSGLHL